MRSLRKSCFQGKGYLAMCIHWRMRLGTCWKESWSGQQEVGISSPRKAPSSISHASLLILVQTNPTNLHAWCSLMHLQGLNNGTLKLGNLQPQIKEILLPTSLVRSSWQPCAVARSMESFSSDMKRRVQRWHLGPIKHLISNLLPHAVGSQHGSSLHDPLLNNLLLEYLAIFLQITVLRKKLPFTHVWHVPLCQSV